MSTEQVITQYEEYVNPAVARLFRFMGLNSVEHKAHGSIIYDENGKQYIDCLGGYGIFALGHTHPAVVEAVKKQLDLMPLSGKILFNRTLADLSEKLAKITPGDLKYSFMVNSGTEAVEAMIKMAKLATGKHKFITTFNSFHGKTLGALSATGRELFRAPFQPLVDGFTHIPFGDIDALKSTLDSSFAGVILEPIQGEGGIILPPDGYLKQVRELCDQHGVLLLVDEVQTGMGRTGKFFAVEHENVVPDIIALAKALGGGVMPIGAIVAREPIWEKFIEAPFLHSSTFGGNQLACAAALATIDVIEKENLLEQATNSGKYFLDGLEKIRQKYPLVITQVRGKGMMIGIDLGKEGVGGMLLSLLIEDGIIIAYTLNNPKVIRIEPALNMPIELIDKVLHSIEKAVATTNEILDEL